jgi:AcrR family transcriptional regulator
MVKSKCERCKHYIALHVVVVNIEIWSIFDKMIETRGVGSEGSGRYHHGNLKETMVKAAIRLIEKRGEASFTIRELAKLVGVSHAAAYRHFRSKRELLAQIAEEGFHGLQASFDESLSQNAGRSCRTRIKALGASYVRYALQHPGHFRAMFHVELQSHSDLPSLKDAASKAFGTLLDAVTEGIARRELVRRPARGLAMVAWSAVHGASLLLLDGQIESPPGPEEAIELVIERMDAGLAQ